MAGMAPAAPPPTLYLESSPVEKQRREHAFNVVEVPRLRLLGFAIVTLLVVVRRLVMPEEPDAHPLLLGAIVFGYSLASWGILYLFFDRVRRINLGTVFLSIDVVAFIVAIYLTGAEKSWLFYLLFIRTADQTNTHFGRAIAFAHLSVGLYAALLVELSLVEHRPIELRAGQDVIRRSRTSFVFSPPPPSRQGGPMREPRPDREVCVVGLQEQQTLRRQPGKGRAI